MSSMSRASTVFALLWATLPGVVSADSAGPGCEHHVAQWLDPASGETLTPPALFERLAASHVVLLGEEHTRPEHHRWQAYVLAALHSRHPNTVVGFEMLPRRAQPALDAWSAGTLTEKVFLEHARWQEVWGYDASLYRPLLQFVRANRVPAVALNVDRELIARVGAEGWRALDEDERQGLSDPAPPAAGYRESLARLFAFKGSMRAGKEPTPMDEIEPQVLEEVLGSDRFSNFVDAQLTWDRAMAEALADAHRRDPGALVVGIVGRGHLEHGYGIPHQLEAMGVDGVAVLLPLDADYTCDPLPADLADAVFIVDAAREEETTASRPRLGVIIERGEGGVRVTEVLADSVAARSGLAVDDVIETAAGFATTTPAALIEVVVRQAPGTWLPLTVLRGEQRVEIVARFP